jgi:hypothetical protein
MGDLGSLKAPIYVGIKAKLLVPGNRFFGHDKPKAGTVGITCKSKSKL